MRSQRGAEQVAACPALTFKRLAGNGDVSGAAFDKGIA